MLYAIYFIYGLCVMFYFMMSWLFYRKDKKLLSRLVAVMMFVIGLQCLKDSSSSSRSPKSTNSTGWL